MQLLGNSQVAERRLFSRRGLLICLACVALVVSLASRIIQLSVAENPTAQADSPKAKIQHLNKDAAQWSAPVASFLLFWLAVTSVEPVSEHKSLLSLHLDNCLYNRPPPRS
jgi:hypothetical protein